MATTPELYQSQIAAARAQAWHQAPQETTTQAAPQVKTQPETEAAAQVDTQTESHPSHPIEDQQNLMAKDQSLDDSDDDAESKSEDDEDSDSEEDDPEAESKPDTETAAERTSSAPATSSGTRILTLEAARAFVNSCGILLFSPRSLGAPAPSLVEATLGAAKTSVTAAESETARSLVARLVAEGSAVPLNLLGGPGDVPDFIVSTAAFPFVFTLRGDKGWKRTPETSGAVKVTTLALHVYEALSEKGALTVAEIVNEVGREITESAVTRSLSELWALVRVIPSLQQGEGATRWELTTARFLKAVKAGANAGQPTALSALVSLYLGQAFLATEDEICTFLSPLTARSRVRDVLHGLSAGRQLSEAVLEGKTVLFLPDSLPDFAAADNAEMANPSVFRLKGGARSGIAAEASAAAESSPSASSEAEPVERIRRFEGGGAEAGRDRNLRGKPAARSDAFRSGPSRPGSRFGGGAARGPRPSRPAPRGEDRPSRPFNDRAPNNDSFPGRTYSPRPARPAAGGPSREGAGDRPSFSRPWDEEKRDRPARPAGDRPAGDRPSRPAFRPGGDRPSRPAFGAPDSRPPRREGGPDRPSFGGRERPSFGNRDRPSFGGAERPPFRREGAGGAPPFRRREESGETGPFRSSFSPGGGGGDREPRGEGRPPRREGAAGGFFPRRDNREGGGDRPRPFRPAGNRPSGSFAPRKSFDRLSREGGAGAGRPFGGGFRPREEGAGGPPRSSGRGPQGRPPFRENGGGGRPSGDRAPRPFGDRPALPFSDRPARDGEAPRSRPSGGFGDRGNFRPGGSADRPSRGSAGGGGFKRAPGGFGRGPAGSRGPSRGPGEFNRGPARGPQGDGPAPRRRPEDEA